MFTSDKSELVFISLLVASMQAGQAAAVQTNRKSGFRAYYAIPAALSPGAFAVSDHWAVLLGCAVGALTVGFGVGAYANGILQDRGSSAYQVSILLRTLLWLACILIGMTLDVTGGLAFGSTAAFALMATITLRESSTEQIGLVPMLGAAAGLIYRNDVTAVRALAPTDALTIWHQGLIAYASVLSLVGFLIVNYWFARRDSDHVYLLGRRERAWGSFVFASFSALVLILSWSEVGGSLGDALAILALSVMATVTAIQAADLHLAQKSWAVYTGGLLGFSVLLLVGWTTRDPAIALGSHLTIIAVVGLAAAMRRPTGRSV